MADAVALRRLQEDYRPAAFPDHRAPAAGGEAAPVRAAAGGGRACRAGALARCDVRAVVEQLQGDLAGIRKTAAEERKTSRSQRVELAHDREALEAMLASRVRGFAFIADAWGDYERARAERLATPLYYKKHPAKSAAKEVRAKGKQLAELRRELKRTQWVLALYEFHFPWLTELRDFEEEAVLRRGRRPGARGRTRGEPDPAQHWLTSDEYAALAEAERNQRALDRYLRSRKSPWQVGRDYERYVGYLREQAGAQVTYQGIFAGLDDLGRDLLCETSRGIEVIQCKRWAQRKTIHEKHVFQLFGTVVALRIEQPGTPVTGTFTTTTTLSERARQFAAPTRHPRRGERPARRLPAHQMQHRPRRTAHLPPAVRPAVRHDHHRTREGRALGRDSRRR